MIESAGTRLSSTGADNEGLVCLALFGDVMTGRAIDQILPHPGDPVLYEAYVCDARDYIKLAESASGPIPCPVGYEYIWGEMLPELAGARTDVRIVNLETSITSSDHHWPNKAIHYRMHPLNIGCITVARINCCCLANNHVLDWGYNGLAETLRTLDAAGVAHAGAGLNAAEAASPVVIDRGAKGRVLVFAFGSTTSGILWQWAATDDMPMDAATRADLIDLMARVLIAAFQEQGKRDNDRGLVQSQNQTGASDSQGDRLPSAIHRQTSTTE